MNLFCCVLISADSLQNELFIEDIKINFWNLLLFIICCIYNLSFDIEYFVLMPIHMHIGYTICLKYVCKICKCSLTYFCNFYVASIYVDIKR